MHKNKNINIIVAIDSAGGFGKNGKIPWKITEDFKHFKELTKGTSCLMGKNTYQDMLEMRGYDNVMKDGHILIGRESYVIGNSDFDVIGATKTSSLRDAIQKVETKDIFILGGKRLFIEALAWHPTIHITTVKNVEAECDVFFPIDYVNTHYKITEGHQTELCFYTTHVFNG